MKSLIIDKNDSNQRLDKFLNKAVPSLPQSLMYKFIRTKKIKVNRKRAINSLRLQEGDVVDLYIKDEFFKRDVPRYDFLYSSLQLSILYEDSNILLLDKKVGLLSHPDGKEYIDTLITRVKHYLYKKGEYDPQKENSFTPALVNRLDRNTGGIVIAAKNSEALRILNRKIKEQQIEKYYLCVVSGKMKNKEETLHAFLKKNEEENQVYIHKNKNIEDKEIITHYKVLAEKNDISLLEIFLITGRTHQIRAHLASVGHPLIGDEKYGNSKLNHHLGINKQLLYSYKLNFNFKTDAGILDYLNGKSFKIQRIDFIDKFFKDNY